MTPAGPGAAETPVALLGDIHTCLLPSRTVLDTSAVVEVLDAVKPGSGVTSLERPVPLAVSSPRVEGVDCTLATASGRAVHGIGTVLSRVIVIGGRVMQSSTQTAVTQASVNQRQPWVHYLARAGTVEAVTELGPDSGRRLADGYLRGSEPDRLDLAAISGRLATLVRMDTRLDRQVPIRAATTRLRWAVEIAAAPEQPPSFSFRLDNDTLRSVRVTVAARDVDAAQRFCEDLAVHDWLLTTITQLLRDADRFESSSDASILLAPMLEQLVPLWMPGAHTPPPLRALWAELEAAPGFTRQWSARAEQLRDRMMTATLNALRNSKISSNDW
ncbi:SCO2521 family protein [Nocardia wallacei]|uniref:SCO2521 family protein n=1 Tax=Nocardia wallacei TaxID=480035 RepID=UPI0024566F6A|nr:SCO2521 family protein [Nocardia wallacei]